MPLFKIKDQLAYHMTSLSVSTASYAAKVLCLVEAAGRRDIL